MPDHPKAHTLIRTLKESSCRPVHLACDDGQDYIVKGTQTGRSVFNDQVVGRIVFDLKMPVADVRIIDIPQTLIDINPESMGHIAPGLAHGSRFVPNCTEQLWFHYVDLPENRPRFASLALLYGWMSAAEKQFIYKTRPPHLVYSFDHDAFFPSGPDWTVETLTEGLKGYPDFDDTIIDEVGLTHAEMNEAIDVLRALDKESIVDTIVKIPASFGPVTVEEREALAEFLWDRASSMRP